MSEKSIHDCIILGSGPAGYTAAIYASRADLKPIVYTGLNPGGQLTTTTEVENFPGYKEGITGPEMMIDLQKQAERFGTKVIYNTINRVEFSSEIGGTHKLYSSDKEILTRSVIISTGASAKYLGLEIEEKYRGRGISSCATCDGFFYKNRAVVVVGAGDTAAEEAIYLSKLCSKVTILIRKGCFRASKTMVNRIMNISNIEVLFYYELKNIKGDKFIETVVAVNNQTQKEINIIAEGVFIAIGHQPNTSIFHQVEKDDAGYLMTEKKSTKTNLPGIFAAGDVQDKRYRQAITAAGSGCMAALDAERYLSFNNS